MRNRSLTGPAILFALSLAAFGLADVPSRLSAGSGALPLNAEECLTLVGGQVFTTNCCKSTNCPKCMPSQLCLSNCCACTTGTNDTKLCKTNGTLCTSGYCNNGTGGCTDHVCSTREIC